MKRVVHIDADIVLYSVGFAAEDDPIEYCCHSAKKLIQSIIEITEADDYVLYLTGKTNFRDGVATLQPYKGNRELARKPLHYEALRSYLTKYHPFIESVDCEADDLLGIACTKEDGNINILASLDKDLNMIEGEHYNWRRKEYYLISQEEADLFFVEQLLTGDATDNIPGLKKITGHVASKKKKDYCKEALITFPQAIQRVRETYLSCHILSNPDMDEGALAQDVDVCLQEIGDLLWIRREGFPTWKEYLEFKQKEEVCEETQDT